MLLTNQIENSKGEVADVRPEIQHDEGLPRRSSQGRLNGNIVFSVNKYFVVGPPLSLTRNLHRQSGVQGVLKMEYAVERLIQESAFQAPVPFTYLELS